MGREVRPVALDWEHPREPGTYLDGSPRYVPLHSRESLQFQLNWRDEHPDDEDAQEPLDLSEYMPEIPEGMPYGWQLYETVSEGTPCSPTFATKDELAEWMASPDAGDEQVSPEAAARLVELGWAPSFIFSQATGLVSGVEWAGRDKGAS